jgi:phage RecT family recombinase
VTERLPAIMERIRNRMPDMAKQLPPNIKPENFLSAVNHALANVPDLVNCEMRSILLACRKAAADGLVPDGRDAVMVVGNAKEDGRWVKKAQYWVMVGGLQKIVYRTGLVTRLESRLVRQGDTFSLTFGSRPGIEHSPAFPSRGDIIGAYCIATFKNGQQYVEWMDRDEIDGIMRRSKSWDKKENVPKGPWASDYGEMARKTVTRRAIKYLPVESLAHRDEEVEDAGLGTGGDDELESVTIYPPDQHVRGGVVTSGQRITKTKPVDELDGEEVAEAEMVEDKPAAPAAPADASTGKDLEVDNWKKALREFRDLIKPALTKEAIEEIWMEWDSAFESVPAEVTAKAKELIEARLGELNAAAQN